MIESSVEYYLLKTDSFSTRYAYRSRWASASQDLMIDITKWKQQSNYLNESMLKNNLCYCMNENARYFGRNKIGLYNGTGKHIY